MQRSDESERSVDDVLADLDHESEEVAASTRDAPASASVSGTASTTRESAGSVRDRLSGAFSVRTFLAALLLAFGGVFFGGFVPVVGLLGRLVGLAAAGFVVGLASGRRRYLEVALAGAVAAAAGSVLVTLTAVFLPFGAQFLSNNGAAIAGVGAGVGVVAAVLGHYVGRDLRDGLTREL